MKHSHSTASSEKFQLDMKELLAVVKGAIQAQGISQEELAKRVGVSIPSIKRWLRGEGILLNQWIKLITALDLSLPDISSQLYSRDRGQFEYTEQQEEALANTPGLLAFFDLILRGKNTNEIIDQYRLPIWQVSDFLMKLDDIRLIRWGLGNKVKILVR